MKAKLRNYDFSLILFWATALFMAFLLGGAFCTKGWQPYLFFRDGFSTTKALLRQLNQTRPELVKKRRYSGTGVVRYIPERTQAGLTLIQGLFPEGSEIRLIDMTGKLVHRWNIDFFRLWPDPKHIIPAKNIPVDRLHYHSHGMLAYPDGSIVFNVAEKGTAKLNKCGEVQWTVDRMTHHSITLAPDGSLWIPAKGDVRRLPDALLFKTVSRKKLLKSNGWYEDRLLKISADGKIQKDISVLQALFDAGLEQQLFDTLRINPLDPTHVNDIEIVTPVLARKIKGVEEGDLLISIRQMHMLAILDQTTGRVKWYHVGPWVLQHDPDITPQGNIEVFNNRRIYIDPHQKRGSNLMSLDPATNETRVIYPRANGGKFRSSIMGAHQLLANGNRLITESMAGRVFEIDPQGDIVWDYIEPYDQTYGSIIESAIRYDKKFFTVSNWECKAH